MGWADKKITRKAIAYARQGYLTWGHVTEVRGAVPGTVAARITAAFLDQAVYCSEFAFWISPLEGIGAPPRPTYLCPGQALEADVWIHVSLYYARWIASELGSYNKELTDPVLSPLLRSSDGRDEERLAELKRIAFHLENVRAGRFGHYNPDTRRLAAEVWLRIQETLAEDFPLPVDADEPEAPDVKTQSPAPGGDETDEATADGVFDADEANEWYSQHKLENMEAFKTLPVHELCLRLGFMPHFGFLDGGIPVLFHGNEQGLHIGTGANRQLQLTNDDDRWVFRTSAHGWKADLEDPGPATTQYDVCALSLPVAEVAFQVSRNLRRLAKSTTGEELHTLLNGLACWGAITSRAEDVLWATKRMYQAELASHDAIQALLLLEHGRYLSPEHRAELATFERDYYLHVDYFDPAEW